MIRDIRQEIILQKVIKANYIAGIEAVTGFGKSRICLNIIDSYKPKSLLIVVPSFKLQDDWIKHLKKRKIKGDVMIINTACKLKAEYDMLCVDNSFVHVKYV